MGRFRAPRMLATKMLGGGGVTLYTISGTVYDSDGTTAVASATVALGALSAVSGADGTYTIADVPAGTEGSMTCTKTGYSWTAITVAAMSGNLTSQNYTNAFYAGGGCLASVVGAYKFVGVANETAALTNLVNGSLPCVKIQSPTWATETGFCGTADGCLNTQLTATNNTWTYVLQFDNTVNSSGIPMGWSRTGNVFIWPSRVGARRYYHGDNYVEVAGGQIAGAGIMGIAGAACYLNGVPDGTIAPLTAITADPCYILARQDSAAGASFFVGGYAKRALIANATLSPAQMAQIAAGMGF